MGRRPEVGASVTCHAHDDASAAAAAGDAEERGRRTDAAGVCRLQQRPAHAAADGIGAVEDDDFFDASGSSDGHVRGGEGRGCVWASRRGREGGE